MQASPDRAAEAPVTQARRRRRRCSLKPFFLSRASCTLLEERRTMRRSVSSALQKLVRCAPLFAPFPRSKTASILHLFSRKISIVYASFHVLHPLLGGRMERCAFSSLLASRDIDSAHKIPARRLQEREYVHFLEWLGMVPRHFYAFHLHGHSILFMSYETSA